MANLISQRLPLLINHRLQSVDLGRDMVYPNYTGNSILNLPASICKILDIPEYGDCSLDPLLISPLGRSRKIIFILVDGLALHRFERWLEDGTAPVWTTLEENGILAPITSVVPSTTSSAITSFWTAQAPKTHGILGYELWLKEYGLVANMVLHAPISFQSRDGNSVEGSLNHAGFKAREYLNQPTLGTYLQNHGVQVHAFQRHAINHSGMSQMFMKDIHLHSFGSAADLWVDVRNWLETRKDEPSLAYVYWEQVDHLSHHYGPDDERPAADFSIFSQAFKKIFLDKLDPTARKDTVIILTADHGQVNTTPLPQYDYANHTNLDNDLHIRPTGENRLMYLFVRPGKLEEVRAYFDTSFKGQFYVSTASELAKTDLFGPGLAHPAFNDRLGDLIAVPQGYSYLWWTNKTNILYGRHGGLHREEMLVPFLAARL